MLKVIGENECIAVQVEADPWIPLTVTWAAGSGEQPLYWRVSGSRGGEVEVKVDPVRGALFEVIVIDPPPVSVTEGKLRHGREGVTADPGVAVVDLSPWGVVKNPDYSDFASRIIRSTEDLSFTSMPDRACLSISENPTARILVCDGVQVHLGEDGTLVGVIAQFSA